jgi:hypothetical protein
VQSTRDDECSRIRLLFANDKAYLFSVTYTPGPLGPDEETDFIFQGFEFRPPEDVLADERAQTGSRWSAGDVSTAALVGLLVVLAGIIWKVIRIRAEANRY